MLLRLAEAGQTQREGAWHLCAALLMLPAVFLAPFNGALGNALPKRWVLTGSAAYCCIIVAVFGLLDGPWVAGWALLAVGAAVYSPTRYALLPAAAVDTHIPLTRVNGWIEMGTVSAIVVGLALGVHLENSCWVGLPAAVVAAVGLNLLPSSPLCRCAFPPMSAVRKTQARRSVGFFRDGGRIWRDREARACLLALASLRAIVTGATGAFIAEMLNDDPPRWKNSHRCQFWRLSLDSRGGGGWFAAGRSAAPPCPGAWPGAIGRDRTCHWLDSRCHGRPAARRLLAAWR